MNSINIEVILYIGAINLIIIGLFGLLMIKNVFRMLLSLVLLESGVNLLLILSGFQEAGIAPIFLPGNSTEQLMNDPVPQALVLTAIVIGVGVQALALALILRVKHHYHTLDMNEIRLQLEHDLAANDGVTAPASAHSPESLVQARHVNAPQDSQAAGDRANG